MHHNHTALQQALHSAFDQQINWNNLELLSPEVNFSYSLLYENLIVYTRCWQNLNTIKINVENIRN